MIVKVQLSIAASDEEQRMLIYDEDRTFAVQDSVSPEVRRRMRDRQKAYFEAHMTAAGVIVLDAAVGDQPW